jgi:transposase
MPRGELSEAQRVYILAQADANVSTREISKTLSCTQRAVQKIIARWKLTTYHTRNDRIGRLPILTSRDHRWLLIIVKRDPTIEYSTLRTAAGLDGDKTTLLVLFRTIARALASTNYSKYRAA